VRWRGWSSTEANLVAACKKCNKARGRLPYAECCSTPTTVVSRTLPEAAAANTDLNDTLMPFLACVRVRVTMTWGS